MGESVQYIDLEEPVYGFEKMLNGDVLDFEMNISLKEDFKFFDNYELQIFNADYSEEVFTNAAKCEETLSVSELSVGKGYKFNVILGSDSVTASYAGQFTIQIEWSSTLVVDLFYRLANLEGDGAAYASDLQEHDDRNDSITGADVLLHNKKMFGTIKSGDVDYFSYSSANKVSEEDPEEDDRTGVANLDFTLTLTPGANICMEFFDENNTSVRKYETKGKSSKIYCRLANIPICAIYKIKITTDSSSTVSYELSPSYEFALAWYGQHTSKDDNGVYWNSNKLDTLKLTCGGATKIVFKQGAQRGDHWMDTSCGIVSAAMILRNLGKTMNGYDFRTNYSGEMMADPFTVILANCETNGTGMNQNSTSLSAKSTHTPDDFYRYIVGDAFGAKQERRGNPSEADLRGMVDKYKYVMVYFSNGSSGHWMVITGYNTSGLSFNQRFVVCDPAANSYATGYNVALEKTTSGYSTMTVSNITSAVSYY